MRWWILCETCRSCYEHISIILQHSSYTAHGKPADSVTHKTCNRSRTSSARDTMPCALQAAKAKVSHVLQKCPSGKSLEQGQNKNRCATRFPVVFAAPGSTLQQVQAASGPVERACCALAVGACRATSGEHCTSYAAKSCGTMRISCEVRRECLGVIRRVATCGTGVEAADAV